MGKTVVQIYVQNHGDLFRMQSGQISREQVRSIHEEALVDAGATMLCLPHTRITELGLFPIETRQVITASGIAERRVYGGAYLTIMGRSCTIDVMEVPETAPPLVGYVVLELLDFVVDPTQQQIIPNPAHEGKFMHALFLVAGQH